MYNSVQLIGNLGEDPTIRYTPGGTAVCNFSMATSKTFKKKDGEKETRTAWHRIVAWGKLAEISAEYLHKGKQVFVEGELQYGSYEDKEGIKRYTTEINIHTMKMLGGKGESNATNKATPPAEELEDVPF